MKSSILDRESVHKVVSILLEADAAVEENPSSSGSSTSALRVIDAFIVPKFRYDPVKKFFHEYVAQHLLLFRFNFAKLVVDYCFLELFVFSHLHMKVTPPFHITWPLLT